MPNYIELVTDMYEQAFEATYNVFVGQTNASAYSKKPVAYLQI